jgi:glycolate oxidase
VAAIIAAGIIPAGLEMMDKPMTAAVEDFVHAGYDLDAEAILLCESDGTPEEVAEEIDRMLGVLRAAAPRAWKSARRGAAPEVLERAQERLPGQRPHQPRLHVHGLHHPAQAAGRHPAGDPGDGKEVRLRCCNVFHAGDGNLHPLILFDANDPDQLHRAEAFGADILEPASPWAAPSPASTAWAWRSSTRCACSSARTSARRWKP